MLHSARKDTICPRPGRGLIGAATLILLVAACDDPQPPAACGSIPQQTVAVGETGTVTACFTDPNEDMLSFAATSSDPGVATASAAGDAVTVEGVSPGTASVTVTATDPGGLEAQQTFSVTVVGVADLLFTEVTPRSLTVSPGDTARAVFTVRNDGSGASGETPARLFQSEDATITTDDTELGVLGNLPALEPSEEVSFNVGVIIPPSFPEGTLYVGVCVDPVPGESDTTNNCSPSVRITVTASSSQNARNAATADGHEALVRFLGGSKELIRVTSGRSR